MQYLLTRLWLQALTRPVVPAWLYSCTVELLAVGLWSLLLIFFAECWSIFGASSGRIGILLALLTIRYVLRFLVK